jgi:hypothetical protein
MQTTTRIKAIRDFFGAGSKPVSMDEMKSLTKEDRAELAPLCAAALGQELVAEAAA